MNVLLCTFGYRQDKIVKAIRTIDHDELILVTGEKNTSRSEYAKILELAEKFGTPVETIIVDIFDFMSCYSYIEEVVRKRRDAKQTVVMNISGGLRLLSDAAMMVAFNNGCEAYYVDDIVRKMPVLKVDIGERLTSEQKDALLSLKDGVPMCCYKTTDAASARRLQAIQQLNGMGILAVRDANGEKKLFITPTGSGILGWLQRSSSG